MTPTKRLRSTYVCDNIRQEIVALLWRGLGHIHILAMGCGAVEIGAIGKGKVVVNRHLNPEDCSGMTWAESAEGWKTEGLCLMKGEIRHDLEGRKKDRN